MGYDEMIYSELGFKLTKGTFNATENLYAYRWTVVLVLGILYKIFGVSDIANVLFSVIPLLVSLFLMLKILEKEHSAYKLIAVCFLFCSPIHLIYLEKPMPDVWVEMGMLMCFWSYYDIRFPSNKSFKINHILFVLGFVIVFLAKESFLIFYPYFLFLMIKDVIQRKRIEFWKMTAILTGLFLVGYFLYFKLQYGNAFVRVDAIFNNRFVDDCSYDKQPFSATIERISYKLWSDLIRNGFLIPVGFLVLLIPKSITLKIAERHTFIFQSLVAFLLLSNFMSISYTEYVPLCYASRHYIFLLPLLGISFSIGLDYLKSTEIWFKILLVTTFIIQLIASLKMDYENTWMLFIPILAGVVAYHFMSNVKILTIFIGIGLLSQYYQRLNYHKKLHVREQKELILRLNQENLSKMRVVTDPVFSSICKFYLGYDTSKIEVLEHKEYSDKLQNVPTYVILNGTTAFYSGLNWEDYPDYIRYWPVRMERFYQNEGGEIFRLKTQK